MVVVRHGGGHGEIIQIFVVVAQILRYMVLIPIQPVQTAQHTLDGAVIVLRHHRVSAAVSCAVLRPRVHQRLPDGVIQVPVINASEQVGIGLPGKIFPAPMAGADGVAGLCRGWCGCRGGGLARRCCAGIGGGGVDVDRPIPVDIKADRLPHVPELHIVTAADGVSL